MFTSDHMIWKYAYYHDELDDWLPYAEDLIKKWSTANEVIFKDTFEIILASLLLIDDLLPSVAKKAYSEVMLDTINQAVESKYTLDSLHIAPPKPGRKEDRHLQGLILWAVIGHLKKGLSKTEAYQLVAEEYFKDPSTVRRLFERKTKGICLDIK